MGKLSKQNETKKQTQEQTQTSIPFKTISDETWFIVQKLIKSNSYIQKQIAYAQKRATGLEYEDFEREVMLLCIETISNCFKMNHECLSSESCVNCPIFEFRLKENLSNYLRKETRDMLIGYAAKDLENYENNIIASVTPDIDYIIEKENATDEVENLLSIINYLSEKLKEKEKIILNMFIKGYSPKIIAQKCNYNNVQSVYIAIKRISNKIKAYLNN